jgi:hypothetical protein
MRIRLFVVHTLKGLSLKNLARRLCLSWLPGGQSLYKIDWVASYFKILNGKVLLRFFIIKSHHLK